MDRTMTLPAIATALSGLSLFAVLHLVANANARYMQRQRLASLETSRLDDLGLTRRDVL